MSEPITVEYYTDAYCAWCWALEDALKAVERTEADGVRWTVRQKPLLRDLEAAGVSGEDVASAWEHIGRLTGSDLDATRWRTDPPKSTLPASRASKVAARFGPEAERKFLRALRPMLFLQGRSAEEEDTLVAAAREAGIPEDDFRRALGDTTTDAAIAEDEKAAAAEGVKNTPALIVRNQVGDRIVLEGVRDVELIRRAIQVARTDQAVADAARERVK